MIGFGQVRATSLIRAIFKSHDWVRASAGNILDQGNLLLYPECLHFPGISIPAAISDIVKVFLKRLQPLPGPVNSSQAASRLFAFHASKATAAASITSTSTTTASIAVSTSTSTTATIS